MALVDAAMRHAAVHGARRLYLEVAEDNAAARALMPKDYQSNPVVFPTGPGMAASEYGVFEGAAQAQKFEEAMTRIRAA